jgi:hypothetical protein
MDPLLQGLFRLRVFSIDPQTFKWTALDALRSSNVYKQLKLKPPQIQALERNLVQEHLSPLTFTALCVLYHIDVAVLKKGHHFVCGSPSYALRGLAVHRLKNVHTYQLTPTKPLYALSHYSLGDLQVLATQLDVPHGTRAAMYSAIVERVAKIELEFKSSCHH